MKRFITTVLGISIFFVGLGAIVDKVAAGFKSDEKALEIIKKARTAIGGDAALADLKAVVIKGRTSQTISIDGTDKIEQGETEIALQLPDKMMKMIKIGDGNGAEGDGLVEKKIDVVVIGGQPGEHKVIVDGKDGEFTTADGKKIVIRRTDGGEAASADGGETKVFVRKKADGGEWKTESGDVKEIRSADGKTVTVVRKGGDGNATFTTKDGKQMIFDHNIEAGHGGMRQNELLRTTLGLLLTAPEGMDVSYTFGGDSNIDGTSVTSVVASFGGANFKLYFDSSSYLPVGMSFVGHPAPMIVKFKKDGGDPNATADVMTFTKKIEGPADGVENLVRFSDYRSTNGVQLPYRWTTSVGGKQTEVFEVTSYEVNPANIGDRFKGEKVMVRTKRPDSN